MINLNHIDRMIRHEVYERLVQRILANGRSISSIHSMLLVRSDAVEAAACGLALQRCCELTYAPTPLAAELAMRLTQMQRTNGHFSQSLAGSAVALKGLLDFLDQTHDVGDTVNESMRAGIADALAAFRRTQLDASPINEQQIQESQIVLWQLADNAAFRSAVGLETMWSTANSANRMLELFSAEDAAPAAA